MIISAFALAATAVASAALVPAATPPSEPAPVVVTAGPATVTLADSHYSTAASQLVVVIEVTTTELVSPRARRAVYVGPDGQQVEAFDSIEPDEVFPGATALVVVVFPAATPGGTVNLTLYDDDFNDFNVSLPVDGNR